MSIDIEKLQITNTEQISIFADSYRSKLVKVYKNLINEKMGRDNLLNHIDGLLLETVNVMKASDEEILDTFFLSIAAHMSGKEIPPYIDDLLETLAQFY